MCFLEVSFTVVDSTIGAHGGVDQFVGMSKSQKIEYLYDINESLVHCPGVCTPMTHY